MFGLELLDVGGFVLLSCVFSRGLKHRMLIFSLE